MGLRSKKKSLQDVALDFKFQPKQAMAMMAEKCELLFGGAAGGGKSWFIRASAVLYALQNPGIQIYVIRKELKSLLQSMMSSSEGFPAMLQPLIDCKLVKINNQEHVIQFKNGGKKRNSFASGSAIRLVHMGSEQAIESITGSELHVVYMDEAASLDPEHIQHILTRVRLGSWTPPHDSPHRNMFPKVVYATNPSGPSRLYLKERFVDKLQPYTETKAETENALNMMFIPSLAIDNDALIESDPGYLDRLKDLDDDVKKDMYLYGKWDTDLSGLFSDTFRREHNVLPRFVIPSETKVYRSYDHGLTNPWAVVYHIELNGEDIIIDDHVKTFPRGTIIIVGELHGGQDDNPDKGLNLTDYEIGQRIAQHERLHFKGRKVYPFVADSATYNIDNNQNCPMRSIVEGYLGRKSPNLNFLFKPFIKKPHSRVDGYSIMRTMFKAGHNHNDRMLEQAGLFVVDDLKNWHRCVPGAPRDPKNIEDCPKSFRDEYLDITRYIVLSCQQKVGQTKVTLW